MPSSRSDLPEHSGWLDRCQSASAWLARWEVRAAGAAMAIVLGLLILNIVTRAIGQALFWVDEAAIMSMVWMAFLASAASLHYGSNIAMTLLVERLPARIAQLAQAATELVLLLFVGALLWMIWNWFDPLTLHQMNWDVVAFSSETFNFIYEEPTQTLGVRKLWFWLILPLFAVGAVFHLCVRLAHSLSALLRPLPGNTRAEKEEG